MNEADHLQRFLFEHLPIRGEYIRLNDSFQTIIQQHTYPEPLRKLIGEALCVAGLLSAIIKFKGRLSVQFRGKGKLKLLLVQCDNHLNLRALAQWDGDLSHEELIQAFQDGVLAITLDAGANGSQYQGVVNWRGNSLAESIEGYFANSEQLATKLSLAVDDRQAVGLLLQIIPGTSDKTTLEEASSTEWQRITGRTTELKSSDLLHLQYKDLLTIAYPNDQIRVFEANPVKFHCGCTRQRGEDAILLLGRTEAEEELKENQNIVVTCDFCNKEYVFDRVDVAQVFEKKAKPFSTNLH